MKKSISFLDKTFWITESKDNPKHVASLQILEMPEGAAPDYVENLVLELRKFSTATSPFNMVVKTFMGFFPLWLKSVDKLDMEYHVQVVYVEDVSDRLKLHKVVARLHEPQLDRNKPLWQ